MKKLVLEDVYCYNERISYHKLKSINVNFKCGSFHTIISDGMLDNLLISILAGIEKPLKGKLIYNKKILANDNDYNSFRSRIGLMILNGNLLENMKVIKNFEIILPSYNIPSLKINEIILKLFKKYEIDETILKKKVKLLNETERFYVLFILAVIHKPDIIIVSDVFPTYELRDKVLNWFLELCHQNDVMVIFVTRNRECSAFGDELWRFNDGRLTFVKKIEDK